MYAPAASAGGHNATSNDDILPSNRDGETLVRSAAVALRFVRLSSVGVRSGGG